MSVELVLLSASVTDEDGRLVTGLRHTNFKVFDKDIQQDIQFLSSEDKPASVAIVYDLSNAVAGSSPIWFSEVSQGILDFIQQSNESNEYTIIGADRNPLLITDWTSDSGAMMEGLSTLARSKPQSQNGLYDACRFALNRFSDRKNLKTALLLITDDVGGASDTRLSELMDLSKRSNGLIYVICPSPQQLARTNEQKMLAKLSVDSGASAFFPTSDDQVKAAFGAIADDLRKRYGIGYYPPDKKRDGSWHPVRVSATLQTSGERNDSELHVRTRSGYYAPDGPPR